SRETWHTVEVANAPAPAGLFPGEAGGRCLAIRFSGLAPGRTVRVGTATFLTPDTPAMRPYELIASPTLYPGQRVTARVGVAAEVGRAGRAVTEGGRGERGRAVTCGLYVK